MRVTFSKLIKYLLFGLLPLVMAVANNQACAENKITFYHYDLLGSPVATTNELGEVVWREEYSPYGDKLLKQDADKDNVRGYTGHVFDEESGLTYMQARYYDPQIGRFMGVDPVGFDSDNRISFNRYAYGNDNPYKYTDPNGEVGVDNDKDDDGVVEVDGFESSHGLSPYSNDDFQGYTIESPNSWGGASGLIKGSPNGQRLNNPNQSSNVPKSTAQTLGQRAADLIKRNGRKNSVTIEHQNGQVRVDLAGKSHHSKELGDVPTPHVQNYKNNIVPTGPRKGQVGSITKDGDVIPADASTLRIVDRYLKSQGQ